MKLLIIEDADWMALGLQEILESRGHEVQILSGVDSLDPFIGLSLDGSEKVAVTACDYDLIFVDGELIGNFTGSDIVPHLKSSGAMVVAISSQAPSNAEMKEAGADIGVRKAIFMLALLADEMFSCARAVDEPAKLDKELAAFDKLMETDTDQKTTLLAKAEALVAKYMK